MSEEIDIFDPLYKFFEKREEKKEEERPIEYPPPYIDRSGREPTLVIPCFCDPKYRWWQKGQSIYVTLVELGAEEEVIIAYYGRDKTFWY